MVGFVILVLAAVAVMFGALFGWAWRRGLIVAEPTGLSARRRVAVPSEPLAYLGGILILAGSGVALGQRWGHISSWGHVAIFAVAAVFFFAIGLVVRWATDPAVQRLIGITWFASVALGATAAGIAAREVYGTSGAVTTLAIGIAVTAPSIPLWLVDRRELQLVVLFTGIVVAACGAIFTLAGQSAPWLAFALGMWVTGVAWAVLGWLYPEPLWTSIPLGTALALGAPGLAVWNHGWLYPVAIATAAIAMVVSIPLRNAVVLAFGTLAMLGYVASAVVRYFHFHQSLGIPQALVSSGALLVGLAMLTSRLRQARGGQRAGREENRREPAGHEPAGHEPAGHEPAGHEPAGHEPARPRAPSERVRSAA